MSEQNHSTSEDTLASRAGTYLLAHYFFSRDVRGTFAAYKRPIFVAGKPAGEKVCLRVELRRANPSQAPGTNADTITMELSLDDVRHVMCVFRGEADSMERRLVRPGRKPKLLQLYRHPGEETLALVMAEGRLSLTAPATPDDGFHFQLAAMKVLEHHSQGLPLAAVWDAFVRVVSVPKPAKQGGE